MKLFRTAAIGISALMLASLTGCFYPPAAPAGNVTDDDLWGNWSLVHPEYSAELNFEPDGTVTGADYPRDLLCFDAAPSSLDEVDWSDTVDVQGHWYRLDGVTVELMSDCATSLPLFTVNDNLEFWWEYSPGSMSHADSIRFSHFGQIGE